MNVEEAMTANIKSYTGITSLITASGKTRFFFDEIPFGTALPAIVAQCISNVPTHTHQGQSKTESPMYQLTAYASTRAGARVLAEQIKAAFCDFVGTMSGLTIQHIKLENDLPDTLTSPDGTVKIHVVVLEFQISYNKE